MIPPVTEENGQIKLSIPAASVALSDAGLFTASLKTTDEFVIQEGRTVEFRVDLTQGAGNDAYAVLAFAPKGVDPKLTLGYSLAKSANEIILVKSLDHYFLDDDSAAATLKHTNVTLVLALTGKDGKVVITGKVLDKDNQDSVLWEKTAVDTDGADFGNEADLATFQKPFFGSELGKGNFALYLYAIKRSPLEDNYQAVFDNAETYVLDTTVLDDFKDNAKTGWTDAPVVDNPALIPPIKEEGGLLKLDIPAASVGLSDAGLFTASVKTTREFTIKEGDRIEFSIDLEQGAGNDAYAVLAFVPKGIDPKQTLGYSLAKSANEIILVKALDHYLLDDDTPAATVKHSNVTLFLSLTGRNGNVVVTGKVLDKENDNAVLWEKTATDTPSSDFGNEDTLGQFVKPFIDPVLGQGNFAVYLYAIKRSPLEDAYRAYFANAVASSPPAAANQPPVISDVAPANSAAFLPLSTSLAFKASDDQELADEKISLSLNGTNYTKADGLTVSGTGGNRVVSLTGKLTANQNYTAVFRVEDAAGLVTTQTLYFDTFTAADRVIEVEDYNFDGGHYFDNPAPTTEGGSLNNAYSGMTGLPDVDFTDTRATPNGDNTLDRPADPVRMQHSLDVARKKFQDAGGQAASVFDYDVGDIAAGEWLNYTRDFAAGSYVVYLRESLLNMERGESVLELVTGDPAAPNQTTQVLGSFLGVTTGFNYRNFALTDGAGQNKTVVRLSGTSTLRLRQVTSDPSGGSRFENYLVLVPVADGGVQRASLSSVSPLPGSLNQTAFPVIQAMIQNHDTSVKVNTVKLEINGVQVPARISTTADGATISYPLTPLPPSESTNTARLSFTDSQEFLVSSEWTFVLAYPTLDPAARVAGPGKERGFQVRIVQATKDTPNLQNSLAQAENQLAKIIPSVYESNGVAQIINYSRNAPASDPNSHDGYFGDDQAIPGLAESGDGTADDLAMEVLTYLELAAGAHRFGVMSDDGFAVASGTPPLTRNTPALASKPSGTADATFDVVVPTAGLYPFRFVWYQHQGGAHVEWFTVDPATGERTLINDPNAAAAVKAYATVPPAPANKLESASTVAGPYAFESSATIDFTAQTISLPVPSDIRFYRLNWGSVIGVKVHFTGIQVVGQTLKLQYELLPVVP